MSSAYDKQIEYLKSIGEKSTFPELDVEFFLQGFCQSLASCHYEIKIYHDDGCGCKESFIENIISKIYFINLSFVRLLETIDKDKLPPRYESFMAELKSIEEGYKISNRKLSLIQRHVIPERKESKDESYMHTD